MCKKTIFLITLIGISSLAKATIWVGGDANCDYSTIQPAINALVQGTEEQLYIANNNTGNGVYTENLSVVNNRDVQIRIRGGYDQCEGNLTEIKTEINGGGLAPVMNISGDSTPSNIAISNFILTDGIYDNNFWSGGLNIDDDQLRISLYDVSILDNEGYYGGGLYSKGIGTLNVTMYRTLIANNTAEYGGGIFCLNNQNITIWAQSGVAYNNASSSSQFAGHGGGIYMDNGCNVYMSSGDDGFTSLQGVVGNSASGDGGGTYINGGSSLNLYQRNVSDKFIVYSDNIADNDNDGSGNGGAIYLKGVDSRMSTNNKDIIFKNNSAVNGGAIALVDGAYAYIRAINGSRCSFDTSCIKFTGNHAGSNSNVSGKGRGGTFYIEDASLTVSRIEVTESDADTGAVAYMENGGELNMDFNLIHNNGSVPSAQFNQNYLIALSNSWAKLSHITLVDNLLNPSESLLLSFNSDLRVNNSIIQSDINPIYDGISSAGSSNNLQFKCNVMHEDNSFDASGDISDNTVSTMPGFNSPLKQDYRLLTGSVAIDKCNSVVTSTFSQVDMEGQATGLDDPTKVNALGSFDAGAYESYQWDVIFADKFE